MENIDKEFDGHSDGVDTDQLARIEERESESV
jgi:hypothetical protein